MISKKFILTILGLILLPWHLSIEAILFGNRQFRNSDSFLERKMREKNETFNGKYLIKKSQVNFVKKTFNFLKAFNCRDKSCFRIGNILVGRSNFIYANSTCGLYKAERFCILDQNMTGFDVPDRTFYFSENNRTERFNCLVCNSVKKFHYKSNPTSHRIENVIFLNRPNRNELARKWWQAENGQQNVYIQFDLESQFLLSNIYIHFKSYPPGALVIEKSFDYGVTWQPIAYYSSNCQHYFPNVPTISSIFYEPKCTDRYSKFDVRELIYRPLSGYRIDSDLDVSVHLKMTNLRFNFSELLMFGDQYMSNKKDDVMKKYFYAINEIRVMGSCFCNGHASVCRQMENLEYDRFALDKMVHSKCECEHKTEGNNCERCLPMYNDHPWMPADLNEVSECKKCECNGHAYNCRFSLQRFIRTNRTSGGVCNNCIHNTEGENCEKCKPGFYYDNSVAFSHPNACKPCNCNLNGSKEFQCNSNKCDCKINVQGDNCDMCRPGYWNLEASNPDGCSKCDVEVNGTIYNKGCDQNSGKLYPCKKNVEGKRCDRCKPGFYSLSDNQNGCSACNCSLGFSYSDPCDPITGQCKCKPSFKGRKCDQIEEGYFCPSIDYLIYEAEESIFINNLTHINKKQNLNEKSMEWTGLGYVRCFEGAIIKFKFKHNHNAAIFDVYLRYALKPSLDQVQIRINNYGSNGEHQAFHRCHDLIPNQNKIEQKISHINIYRTNELLISNYCFEKHHTYEIEITVFKKPNQLIYNSASEALFILVDSIILVPNFDVIKNQIGLDNQELDSSLICKENYLKLPKVKSDKCDQLLCQMASSVFGLLPCQCNVTGSNDIKCDSFDGQCKCKHNIIGRQCDKCDPYSWGFSNSGCLACNCNSSGSISDHCDLITGQCECREFNYGRSCSDCQLGYFDAPKCRKCECNGFSSQCQSNGQCLNCMQNTYGWNCEQCKPGFYGSPKDGIGCKPCNCPGINGNNFANSCSYNFLNKTFTCDCQEGYSGPRCDKCDNFYYGNPLEINKKCKKCNCNGNVDEKNPETCDKNTGKCLNCLYETDGYNCEKCKYGYYGNALKHDCKPCECNKLGTVNNTSCDSEFGFCECLPKVMGKNCDECAQNFWNLQGGNGCIECDCDIRGTVFNSTQCDQKTGQCSCLPDRSGRRCDQCPFGEWGNPYTGCKKCICSSDGSASQQCDKLTGHCKCLTGVVGYHCDRCDRGTTGSAPHCKKCGECFDNWDKTIYSFNKHLENLEEKSLNFYTRSHKRTYLTGFQNEYEKIIKKLEDMKKALSFNQSNTKLETINFGLKKLKSQLNYFKIFAEDNSDIFALNSSLIFLYENYQTNRTLVDSYLRQTLDFQESFLQGAINSIEISEFISNQSLNEIMEISPQFESIIKSNLDLINNELIKNAEKYHNFTKKSKNLITNYELMLKQLNRNISDLNKVICGSNSSNCSEKCGAIGCGNCGVGCDSFVNTYSVFKNLKEKVNQTFDNKGSELKEILTRVNSNRLGYKKFNDDLESLKLTINNDLIKYENKRTFIKNLINEMFNLSDIYQSNIETIDNFNQLVLKNETKLDLEIDSMMESISKKEFSLKNEFNFDKIRKDLEKHKKINISKFDNTEKISKLIEYVNNDLNETWSNFDETRYRVISQNNSLSYAQETNLKINTSLESLKFKLDTVKGEIDKIMIPRSRFKEVNETLVKSMAIVGKENLALIKEKIISVEKIFTRLTQQLKISTNDEIMIKVIKLMDKIMKQSEKLSEKLKKIEKLKIENFQLGTKIESDKSNIYLLKEKINDLRNRLKVDKLGKIVCSYF